MLVAFCMKQVRQGLDDLAKRAVKTSTVVQGALPSILSRTPESFFEEAMQFIEVRFAC